MENNSRDSLVYYVWLSMQTGISYISRFRLLQQYGSAEELYKAAQKTEPAAEKKLAAVSLDAAAGVIEKCRQQNIIPIPLNSPLYPKRLACIDDPPFVLYVKGSLQDFLLDKGTQMYTYDFPQDRPAFVSPVYEDKSSRQPDFRHTLYFDAAVSGQREFYTSDLPGTYEVRLQYVGLDDREHLITSEIIVE